MIKILGCCAAMVMMLSLSGCNRNNDDCDDAAPSKSVYHGAVSYDCECVPAPAPMVAAPVKAITQSDPPAKARTAVPMPATPGSAVIVIERREQVVEARSYEPVRPQRVHHILSGEIEIDDL